MRLIFCLQASKTKQHQNKTQPDFGQWLIKVTQLTALSLTILGFGYFTQQKAPAETARIDDITIDRQPDETYDSLVQRAETAATAALEQGFSRGSQITDVSVVILGQNQGAVVPVLAIGLSRPQWSSGGDKFIYFNSARSLLRLDEQQVAAEPPEGQGSTPSSPPPGQQPNNPTSPGSAREIINNAPVQPATPAPEAAPLPGSPALVPRPQVPGVPPVTSPGDNLNTTPLPGTSPGDNTNPTPLPGTSPGDNTNTTAPPITPSPQNLPQGSPGNNSAPDSP